MENKNTDTKKQAADPCPEFQFFGAWYPDARCIDGNLYDLDKCDDAGNLYVTDEYSPCPFCRQDDFLEQHVDELNGVTKGDVLAWLEKMHQKYK
jgi:hypothetical protein